MLYADNLPTRLWLDLVATIAKQLCAEGYVCYYDMYADQYRIYRTTPPASVARADMLATIRTRAAAYLDDVAAGPPRAGRNLAASMADDLRTNARGTGQMIRTLFEYVRDDLPELTKAEAAELRAELAADRRTPKARASRPEYYRTRRATAKAAARSRCAGVVAKWLRRVGPGKHRLPDLWSRWQAEVVPTARRKAPEVAALGRNDFYAALAETTEVHSGGGHTRYIVVR